MNYLDLLPIEILEKINRIKLLEEFMENVNEFDGAKWSNGYRELTISEYYKENMDLFDEFENK